REEGGPVLAEPARRCGGPGGGQEPGWCAQPAFADAEDDREQVDGGDVGTEPPGALGGGDAVDAGLERLAFALGRVRVGEGAADGQPAGSGIAQHVVEPGDG